MLGKLLPEVAWTAATAGSSRDETPNSSSIFAGVALAAMAAEGIDHAGVESLEGFEDADAGGECGESGTAPGEKDACGDEGGQEVAHAGDSQNRGEDLHGMGQDVGHRRG